MFKNRETTSQLPNDIKAVSKAKNLYESDDIKKAGYKEIEKVTSKDNGSFTIWRHNLTGNTLIFIEKQGGLYQFGGYVKEKGGS